MRFEGARNRQKVGWWCVTQYLGIQGPCGTTLKICHSRRTAPEIISVFLKMISWPDQFLAKLLNAREIQKISNREGSWWIRNKNQYEQETVTNIEQVWTMPAGKLQAWVQLNASSEEETEEKKIVSESLPEPVEEIFDLNNYCSPLKPWMCGAYINMRKRKQVGWWCVSRVCYWIPWCSGSWRTTLRQPRLSLMFAE